MNADTIKLVFYIIISLYTIGVLVFVRNIIVNKIINKKKRVSGIITMIIFAVLLIYPVTHLLLLFMHLLLQLV